LLLLLLLMMMMMVAAGIVRMIASLLAPTRAEPVYNARIEVRK